MEGSLSTLKSRHGSSKRNSLSPCTHISLDIAGPCQLYMLKLAELLCLSGIQVTFLNTEYIHRCLLRHTNVLSHFKRYPKFRFETVSDGLAEDHPRTADELNSLINSMKAVAEPLFKEMLSSGSPSSRSECPVTVIIPDGYFTFALDVAEEIGLPLIYFETISPCRLWTFLRLPDIIEAGEVPFKGAVTPVNCYFFSF